MKQISPADFPDLLEEKPDAVLLDVREAWEREYARLGDSVHIPLALLPLRLQELDPAAAHVVYCHHGARSRFACSLLERAGFRHVYNLRGGINLWSQTVDPSIPRY